MSELKETRVLFTVEVAECGVLQGGSRALLLEGIWRGSPRAASVLGESAAPLSIMSRAAPCSVCQLKHRNSETVRVCSFLSKLEMRRDDEASLHGDGGTPKLSGSGIGCLQILGSSHGF